MENMRLKRIISLVALCLLVPLSCISGQDPCPDGYGFSFQNSCYKFVSRAEDQTSAASNCASDEAHLADIKSAEEQEVIVSWLKSNTDKDVWIGLVRQGAVDFVWTDGSPLDYSAWAPGEPNAAQCVRLQNSNNYQWNDRACSQNYPYICEIEALGCPPGWHFLNQFCYFVDGQQQSTYDQARDACIRKNATLSSINNQDEQNVHNRFVTLHDNLWIGLNDKAMEDIWQWEDTSTYYFKNWAPDEPNNSGENEDCAHLREGFSGQWNDERCNREYGYVCKMPSAIPAPTTTALTTATMTTTSLTSPVNGPTPDATTAPTSGSTRTIPANRTDIGGTPNPQSGVSPGAIAGAVIGTILLLVLILLILFLIASRSRHKKQTKSGKTISLAFDGPYDLTIEGKPHNTEQPIYTDADNDNKQQPIYADPTSTKTATDVYQSIGESSTDDNTAPVYVDIDPNNDAPNSNKVSVTGEQESSQETSLYYARSDSHQDANGAPITAVQESHQEGSLYYAKSDSHPATNGYLPQESSAANTGTGWEDNAAYSSFEDGELVHDQDNLGGQREQEGWEDNGLYSVNGVNGNNDDEEEWKDNSIYAGSDPE